jgi:hypothetical protein
MHWYTSVISSHTVAVTERRHKFDDFGIKY